MILYGSVILQLSLQVSVLTVNEVVIFEFDIFYNICHLLIWRSTCTILGNYGELGG